MYKRQVLDGFPRTIPQAKALYDALTKIGEKMDYAIDVDAVSYTHLDVYKRQLENRVSFRRAMKSCMGRAMTVSYTHLDVYKRQVWYNATVRGDSEPIEIGRNSNIQDNAVVHVDLSHSCLLYTSRCV